MADANEREVTLDAEDEQSTSAEAVLYITQEDLNRLITQRNHAIVRITNIIDNISAFQNDILSLETRREILKDGYRNYDQHQNKLEQVLPDEIKSRDDVDIKYIAGLSSFEKSIRSMKTNDMTHASRDTVRLPTVDLPVFSGSGENWLEWFDKFNALIHLRTTLATIQKFEYLKLSLRGSALGLIDSLPTTEANYEVAYDMLVRRYNNPKLLIQKHTRELFELKALNVESAVGLRNLIDGARKHLRCLQILNQPVEAWDAILIHLIANKLDPITRREWEAASSGSVPQSYNMLENFVTDRCQMLEAIPWKRKLHTEAIIPVKRIKPEGRALTVGKPPFGCAACRGDHFLGSCNRYRAKSLDEKLKMIKNFSLCYNCLKANHTADQCRNRGCLKCDGKHHTSIHRERKVKSSYEGNLMDKHRPEKKQISTPYPSKQETTLPTASVLVHSSDRPPILCCALLDSGSQFNFATKSLINRLGVSTNPTRVNVYGFGQYKQPVREKALVSIESRVSGYRRTVPVLVTDTITGSIPTKDIDTSNWNLADVNLADPDFHLSKPVDILLGVSIMFEVIRSGNKEIGEDLPRLQNTTLGWIVGGGSTYLKANQEVTMFINETIHSLVSSKWTEEESLCEQWFIDTTTRTEDGRFTVRLPRKSNADLLGESKSLALGRFLRLEKRFDADPSLHHQYSNFISEYLELGHMSKMDDNDLVRMKQNGPVFYCPHHPVLRPESTTTKLRVVFNGSAASSSGLSLNDVLMTGPTIQQDTFSILIRFRFPKYVLIADLEKMFRQILTHEADCQLQLILWRFSSDEAVSTYRLNTVTYGTCSAPYVAARCLKQLAIESKATFPEASRVIEMDFYMDDMLTGLDNLDDLKELKEEITSILSNAGFNLHKWKSNSSALIADETKGDDVKILGLRWNSASDVFGFQSELQMTKKISKRNVLSEIQKIYDPLGILCPIIVHGKLIMQDIWSQRLDWDDALPDSIADKWKWFCVQIAEIQNITFPRRITAVEPNPKNTVELHGFSDAAKRAYGAAIYVRTITENSVQVRLLCAKSRVTPTSEKSTDENNTIPRMELRAAALQVDLMAKVKAAMFLKVDGEYYWTDSTVTLDWIASPTKRRPQFITNRVNQINAKTSINDWYHVSSGDNPADPISRGSSVKTLAKNSLWWTGPTFLSECDQPWKEAPIEQLDCFITRNLNQAEPQEQHDTTDYSLIEQYSSIGKLQRVAAYCIRFKNNCLTRDSVNTGSLTANELKNALKHIIRMCQKKYFHSEIKQLSANQEVNKSSSLLTLRPFLDQDGLLRVGGRIQAAGLDYDQLHPVILPAKCNVTQLIAIDKHQSHLHIGPQGLLYAMRLNYWPIHGKSLVRKVVHQCLTCFRNNPQTLKQIMGEIPEVRITPGRPFQTCGVDFGGPFTIKENFVRTQKTLKVYVALFICLRTRAIHLELVSSLSSAAFIAALRRFSSQRGRSTTIFCDNATNFVGSKNEIHHLTDKFINQIEPEMRKFCATEQMEWKFIPPRSPNFGGIWEAGIKSVKHHLKRVLGSTIPTYEEMLTLLKQIEGCLNSRPISPLSTDVRDPNPLTPGHFLVGGPIMALPDQNFCETSTSRLTRYEEVQKNLQLFWKRWRIEYLNNLQQRTKKWSSKQPDLLIGQLCLVKDDALPPNTWITGRVIKLHPGPDHHVRVATLITAKGEIKRSISKLCLLPIEDVGGLEHVK